MAILNILDGIRNCFQLIFGSSVEVAVQPQQLLNASQKLSSKATSVQYQLNSLSDRVASMNKYWEGNVYGQRKQTFQREFENMESVISSMEIYSQKLKVVSENYIKTEDINNDSAEALPLSIIS